MPPAPLRPVKNLRFYEAADNLDQGSHSRNAFRQFSEWVPWDARVDLSESKWGDRVHVYPGVYLLAHFRRAPRGAADFLDNEIIYVGEGQHLRRRWYDFERSAYRGLPGHSGGHSYRRKFKRSKWSQLHVSALPVWFGDDALKSEEDWTTTYRKAVERWVLWKLTVARGGTHGLLNAK